MSKVFVPKVYDGVYVKVNGCEYKGRVTEVEEEGFWLTEDYQTEEYIAYADIVDMNVLVYNTELI